MGEEYKIEKQEESSYNPLSVNLQKVYTVLASLKTEKIVATQSFISESELEHTLTECDCQCGDCSDCSPCTDCGDCGGDCGYDCHSQCGD